MSVNSPHALVKPVENSLESRLRSTAVDDGNPNEQWFITRESHPETDSKKGGIYIWKNVSILIPYTCLGDPGSIAIPVVASVAGVLGLVIVPIIIWRLLKRPQNDEGQPLLDQDNADRRVDESENYLSCSSEAGALTLGNGSASSANPSSTAGSSCSDITAPNKDGFNNKINRNAEGRCWAHHMRCTILFQ